jgi:hypothetical protein
MIKYTEIVLLGMLLLVGQATCWATDVTVNPIAQSSGLTAAPSVATAQDTSLSASEVLKGNGTRAGYVLGHGSVIAGSETVYVGVRRAKKNTDYTIDYTSGSLFFTEPVGSCDSVRVDYRYAQGARADRNVSGPGGMLLRFGEGTQTSLTYAYRTANQDQGAPDILTYGANTTSKLGSSSISSMMYVATPQAPNRVSLSAKPAAGKSAPSVKKDQLMVQSADLGMGGLHMTLGYQNVGENFAGFDALRESGAGKTDILNQLEKEKGITRIDMAGEMGAAGGMLNFSRGSIDDKKGGITSQSIAFTGPRMRFGYSSRDVAKTFTRFNDIREADRAQLAREVGVSRNQYFLQFKASGAANAGWNSFTNTTLTAEDGALTYRSANVDLGMVRFQADVRSSNPEFTEMKAINDEERTQMALAARQQFDPTTQASAVDAVDKARVEKEAGLDRANYRAQCDVGPVWLSLTQANLSTTDGGLSRTDYFVKHKSFALHVGRHRIDQKFDRLPSMQAAEVRHFGNERGMSRTDMDGQFKFGFGDFQLSHKHVVDQQGAGVNRDKLDYTTKGVEFHANLQSIDPRFSRLADLSDEDKQLLAQDLGFRRSDYTIGVTALRNVNVKSYFYDSTNSTAGQTRGQTKHEISYVGPKGMKVTGLLDDFSYMSDAGAISSYSRRRVTFDNTFSLFGGAVLFSGVDDANTTVEQYGTPVSTQVSQAHFEINPGAKTSYVLDSSEMDLGKGRFENTRSFGLKSRMSKKLSILGTYGSTDRGVDSEANATFGLDWLMTDGVHLTANIANRDGGPKGSQQSHQMSFNGTFTSKKLGLEDVKVGSAVNTTQLAGRQTACDNGLKIDGKFLKGSFLVDNGDKLNPKNGIYYTSRIVSYVSDPDPKKWYHLTYFRQNMITPTSEFARKRNYALAAKVNSRVDATASSYFGKDGQNGAVLPVGGGVFKIRYSLPHDSALFADYSADLNESTLCRARTTGLGFTRTMTGGSKLELYWGWSRLTQSQANETDTVFRVAYDRKLNPERYLTLSAQKKSAVDKTAINPYEGKITASLDFRMSFH